MKSFVVSPDDCLVLRAIHETNSLREAARALNCDPAGLARKVQAIASEHGVLQKAGPRWKVTPRGLELVAWLESTLRSQREIFEARASLRIAATSWLSTELLIPALPLLRQTLSGSTLALSVPHDFAAAVLEAQVDFVIVCHAPENPDIEHRQIATEPWTIVAPGSWKRVSNLKTLSEREMVRHTGLNLDLFIPEIAVKSSAFAFDNLASVREAVLQGYGWSVVPRWLVARDLESGRLAEVAHELAVRDRKLCLWWLRNRHELKRLAPRVSGWLRDAVTS